MTAPQETVTNQQQEAGTATGPDPQVTEQQGNEQAADVGDAGKRAIDAMKSERNAAKARADELATKLREFEDRDKTELQKAQEAAQSAQQRLADIERQNALLSKGIPADLTPPAHNAPADEWSGYAQRLLDWRGQVPAVPAQQPRPTSGQGVVDPQHDQGKTLDQQYAEFEAKYFPTNKR